MCVSSSHTQVITAYAVVFLSCPRRQKPGYWNNTSKEGGVWPYNLWTLQITEKNVVGSPPPKLPLNRAPSNDNISLKVMFQKT